MSANFSLSMLILVLTVCRIVLLYFNERVSYNKLTMLPFDFLIGYSLCSFTQFAGSFFISAKSMIFPLYLLPLNRMNFLFFGVNIQLFEWLNCWFVIQFQRDYDITTVCIEKRKFQPRERMWFRSLVAVHLCIAFISNVLVLCTPVFMQKRQDVDVPFVIIRDTMVCYLALSWLLFIPVITLLPRYALRFHNRAFLDYRISFWTQASGTLILLLI